MSAPGFWRPIWLVQLSLLEAPAVVRLNSLAPRSIRSEPGSRTFFHRFLSSSHRQQSALLPWCQRASSFLVLPKNFFYSHWRKTLPRQGFTHRASCFLYLACRFSPSSAFRLGSAPGALGLDTFSSFEGSQRVSYSSPIRLVNPLLSSSSLPLLYFTGAENTTLYQ